jgi:hypothetical protein
MQNSQTNVFVYDFSCFAYRAQYVLLCETSKNNVLARKNEDSSLIVSIQYLVIFFSDVNHVKMFS